MFPNIIRQSIIFHRMCKSFLELPSKPKVTMQIASLLLGGVRIHDINGVSDSVNKITKVTLPSEFGYALLKELEW